MPELTRRYVVMTMAAAAPFDPADRDAPFVLKPWKDPTALVALKAYRNQCYPELARDLDEWIRVIEAGPAVRGDVGQRNEGHIASGKAARARSAAKAARTTATRKAASKRKAGASGKPGAKRPRVPRRATRSSKPPKRR